MALAATPVSAAAEQQHEYDDNQEQFHGKPPLLVRRHLLARRPAPHSSNKERRTKFSMRPIKFNALEIKSFRVIKPGIGADGRARANFFS
jgi:hypothetical protein